MENKTKQQLQVEQRFLYTLAQVIEVCPQYTIAQHITHFLRKKNALQEAYFWTDLQLLKRLEDYYDEIKTDLITNNNEEQC